MRNFDTAAQAGGAEERVERSLPQSCKYGNAFMSVIDIKSQTVVDINIMQTYGNAFMSEIDIKS